MIKKSYSRITQTCRDSLKLPSQDKAGTEYMIREHNPGDAEGYVANKFGSEDARVVV